MKSAYCHKSINGDRQGRTQEFFSGGARYTVKKIFGGGPERVFSLCLKINIMTSQVGKNDVITRKIDQFSTKIDRSVENRS